MNNYKDIALSKLNVHEFVLWFKLEVLYLKQKLMPVKGIELILNVEKFIVYLSLHNKAEARAEASYKI